MDIHVTAGMVQAVVAAVGVLWGLNLFVIRAIFNRMMLKFIDRLNGRYVYANKANITGSEIARRLNEHSAKFRSVDGDIKELRDKHADLHEYVHKWIHYLRNVWTAFTAREEKA